MEQDPDYANKGPPLAREGWKSASQLETDHYVGRYSTFQRKLISLQLALIDDVVATGVAEVDAKAIVEHNLIGLRRTRHGNKVAVLHAAPEALELMDVKLQSEIPRAPSTWRSASQLSNDYIGGRKELAAKLEYMKEELRKDLTHAGLSEEDAVGIVERHLVGSRRSASGPPAQFASPVVIEILKQNHMIRESRNNAKNSR